MAVDIKRSGRDRDRIFDRFVDRTFTTTTGHKAIFAPSKGGSNTTWQNRTVIVSLEVSTADGNKELYEISAGIIQGVSTNRKSGTATLSISSLEKGLVDVNAEKIKDGDQFHENRKLSFLMNSLLVEVFKDNQNNLPDDKRVSAELLTVKTIDNKLGYWSLETYPGFDGNSYSPAPTAIPMTALATNEDRSIIWVATGGVNSSSSVLTAANQDRQPELWQYDIDEDKWSFLATTSTGDFKNAPIHNLYYNTKDEKLYGTLWQDYGDTQADIESSTNKVNWVAPPAGIFKWDVNSDSGYINDSTHLPSGAKITNYWPGTWDFRMMYPFDHASKAGASRETDTQAANETVKSGELETHKLSYARASVGNFTAYRYTTLPFGPAGQQGFSDGHEARRGTHWMHPQVSGFDDTQRPANDIFGTTVELTPTTLTNGNTYWDSASGSTQPTGWTKHGSPTFSLSGTKVLTMATASDSDAISFTLSSPVNNMTVYKLRLTGENFKASVTNTTSGTPTHSQVYGPIGMSNSADYTATTFGNGDYYFAALETDAIPGWYNADNLRVYLTALNHSSDVVMTNISLSIAHHWDNWHNLSRMAAENIPITHFSKIIGATSIRRPTHQFKGEPAGPAVDGSARNWGEHAGPHQWFYDMFDDGGTVERDDIQDANYVGNTDELNKQIFSDTYDETTGMSQTLVNSNYTNQIDRQPPPFKNDEQESSHLQKDDDVDPTDAFNIFAHGLSWQGQLNEELVMEFNAIAQDRRNLSQIGSDGMHPLYGPNDLEDGLQPDNSYRHQVGSRNIGSNSAPLNPTGSGSNEAAWRTNDYGFTTNYYSNEAVITDLGPFQPTGISGIGSSKGPTAGIQRFNASDSLMQKSNQGFGYASVVVQGLGERAAKEEDTEEIYGAVRYTNSQQGCTVFNQEADSGNGIIIFQRFNGTAPQDGSFFRWDPDATSGQNGHWDLKWSYYKCSDGTIGDITSTLVAPVTRSVSAVTPHSYTVVPIYGTAACSGEGGNVFIATHESRTHSALYTGSNEDDILNRTYIHRVALGTGSFSAAGVTTTKIYDSSSDASVYNADMDGSADGGRFANYAAGNANNKTRKILTLHYNSDLSTNANGTNGLFGACFKRDALLAEYNDTAPFEPCHEVFVWAGTSNALKILDHDVQDGNNYDAVGFTGFANTKGKFGHDLATPLSIGSNNGIVYFRLQKASVKPLSARDRTGLGVKVSYLFEESSGSFNSGNFIDDQTVANTKLLYENEGMISNGQAVTGLIDLGRDSEREGIFAAFDDYRSWYTTSQKAKNKLAFGSIKHWFKIDDREIDPRIELADFTGLKAFDAIAKLATANNMLFGFDVEKFFLINRDDKSNTHTLDALDGDIIDLTKEIDNDVRNAISIQAFRPQVKDIEWEVTHVGGPEVLNDEQLFNGEFTITPNTHREASINLICTRSGRLTRDNLSNASANAVDSITNIGSRPLTPLFKWRVNTPTKQVVLMRTMSSTDTTCFLNTLFASGLRSIQKGEIIMFTNPTTLEQVGRVIINVDTSQNRVDLEDAVGFEVEESTPLHIVSAGTGSNITSTGASSVSNYGTKYSDEGVCIITDVNNEHQVHGVCGNGNYSHYNDYSSCNSAHANQWTAVTRLTVNTIRPFADIKLTPYSPESYKHYSFLVTTLSSSQLNSADLPDQADSANATATTNAATEIKHETPAAFIKAIDEENAYIYLNGTYNSFEIGDVLNAHYVMAPATLIMQTEDGAIQPPPYTSIQQELPEGLGTWSWKCDSGSDKFLEKAVINLKFQGYRLEKDSSAIYTIADAASIARYGKRDWNFPDNRFIRHDKAEYWASKYLKEFGDPKYLIKATIPFDPSLTFTTPAGNALRKVTIVDEVMFPSLEGFSISGYLRQIDNSVKALKTTVVFRSDEKY